MEVTQQFLKTTRVVHEELKTPDISSGSSSDADDGPFIKELAREWNGIRNGSKTKVAADSVEMDIKLLGTREAERNLLILLNQRLERVIDRNREIQKTNDFLKSKIEAESGKNSIKTKQVSKALKEELDELRRELASTKKEATDLAFQLGDVKKEADGWESRASKAEAEVCRIKAQMDELEAKLADISTQFKKAVEAVKKAERHAKERGAEAMKQEQAGRDARIELKKEIMAKHELEKALRCQIDELVIATTNIEAEAAQLKLVNENMANRKGDEQQKKFDGLLQTNMRQLREDYSKRLAENKKELTSIHRTKENNRIQEVEVLKGHLATKTAQLEKLSKEVASLIEAVRGLEAERATLLVKLRDLKQETKGENKAWMVKVERSEALLQKKTREQNELVDKFQTLLDVKVALDNELAVYKTLLESEEARLKIADVTR